MTDLEARIYTTYRWDCPECGWVVEFDCDPPDEDTCDGCGAVVALTN